MELWILFRMLGPLAILPPSSLSWQILTLKALPIQKQLIEGYNSVCAIHWNHDQHCHLTNWRVMETPWHQKLQNYADLQAAQGEVPCGGSYCFASLSYKLAKYIDHVHKKWRSKCNRKLILGCVTTSLTGSHVCVDVNWSVSCIDAMVCYPVVHKFTRW